jgi:Protein of unknown function, DUF255
VANRLTRSMSPYLRQHAENQVDWGSGDPSRSRRLGAAEYLSFERWGRCLPLVRCDSDLRVSLDVLTQVHQALDEHGLAWEACRIA